MINSRGLNIEPRCILTWNRKSSLKATFTPTRVRAFRHFDCIYLTSLSFGPYNTLCTYFFGKSFPEGMCRRTTFLLLTLLCQHNRLYHPEDLLLFLAILLLTTTTKTCSPSRKVPLMEIFFFRNNSLFFHKATVVGEIYEFFWPRMSKIALKFTNHEMKAS